MSLGATCRTICRATGTVQGCLTQASRETGMSGPPGAAPLASEEKVMTGESTRWLSVFEVAVILRVSKRPCTTSCMSVTSRRSGSIDPSGFLSMPSCQRRLHAGRAVGDHILRLRPYVTRFEELVIVRDTWT
jgi:hypothetical protein